MFRVFGYKGKTQEKFFEVLWEREVSAWNISRSSSFSWDAFLWFKIFSFLWFKNFHFFSLLLMWGFLGLNCEGADESLERTEMRVNIPSRFIVICVLCLCFIFTNKHVHPQRGWKDFNWALLHSLQLHSPLSISFFLFYLTFSPADNVDLMEFSFVVLAQRRHI